MMPVLQVIDLITTGEGTRFAPAGRMASAIIEIINANGECQEQDLMRNGFTAEEIRAHSHMAKSLADVEMALMGSERQIQHCSWWASRNSKKLHKPQGLDS